MITKYARIEQILEVKTSKERLPYEWNQPENTNFKRFAALKDDVKEEDGYLYVRTRAISSRVNKNNDGWPSEELANAYSSFVGRPVFVDHNNEDPKRTRGVIVDSKLHVDDEKTSALDPYYADAPDNHKPPTWIELLIEVDGKTYPKLANAIRKEDIDAVSMGANIKESVCSVCANSASTPDEFCDHIKKKGLTFEITSSDGEKIRKKAYEDCHGVDFFEISFVFDPADETALITEKTGKTADMEKHSPGKEHMKGVSPKRNRQYEHILDSCRKEHPDWDEDKCKEYAARTVNKQRAEKGETKDSSLEEMLGKNLPMERVAELQKTAYPDASMFVRPLNLMNPDQDAGERGYEPQSDAITAPQEVNTLRKENLCPVCRASDMEHSRDGILECPVCGHLQEPAPTDNPDLSLAQDADLRGNTTDEVTTEGDPEVPAVNPANNESEQITFTPLSKTRKSDDTTGVISEMFETILTTASKEIVDSILPLPKKATVETTLGVDYPINRTTLEALKAADLNVSIEYPGAASKRSKKVELQQAPPIFHLLMTEDSARRLKTTFANVPLVLSADTEEEIEKALEIIRTTEPKARTAAKPKSTILPEGKKITDAPKNEKVLSDQLAPVESADVHIHMSPDEPVAEAVPSLDDPIAEEAEVVEAAEEETPSVEEVVEEVTDAEEDTVEDADEDDKEAKLLAAFKLADLSVEMGLVNRENKMVFISELEQESLESLKAREKTLSSVKEAGLSKKTSSSNGKITRIPRLSHNASVGLQGGQPYEVLDEALFL